MHPRAESLLEPLQGSRDPFRYGCGSSSSTAQGRPGGFCERHGKSYLTLRRRGGEGGGGGLLTGRAIPSAYRWAWCRWCSASITLAARVASFENATGLPQKDRTRAFRFGLGSGARGPGRSRWSPPGQPAGGVAPASWLSPATSAAISFRASIAIGNPKAFRGDAVGSAKRRRRAARRRQSRTRRCKVRSWPGRNTPGCSRQRRSKSSFAVRCGSVSSHWTIRGQLVSNGSCRGRHLPVSSSPKKFQDTP